tara:strand:- start:147 stop:368 length:222 start_codon:yes stop_codon:yes gene_type:complete
MKKLIIFALLLFPLFSFSQELEFYEGTIYFNNGEVKEGLVRLPVSAKYLKSYGNSLQFKENEEAKKEKYRNGE